MNLTKGFKNIFSPSLTNLLIVLSLIIIVILVYIKNKTIDLFDANSDFLQLIINKYQDKQEQRNNFAITLATQEQTIQNLEKQVSSVLSVK
jgi:hypothetical protein